MKRFLVLIDGIHTRELLAELDAVLRLAGADLLLVYVRGHAPRAGLDLVRRRPGGLRMPPHREHAIGEAERHRAADALEEAERFARPLAASVRTVFVDGEPGRAVVELAERERVDLVAVRAGRSGAPGPAARFILDHSRCTVVLLR
jgi:nucleotide-binding universal stress UspA family protein